MQQLSLLAVLDSYGGGAQANQAAYGQLGKACGIPAVEWDQRQPIGRAAAEHSPLKRRVRWYQQTLRRLGLLEPVAGRRGHWAPTAAGVGEARGHPSAQRHHAAGAGRACGAVRHRARPACGGSVWGLGHHRAGGRAKRAALDSGRAHARLLARGTVAHAGRCRPPW